ncbi:hypothetical protein CXF85_17910 [Colwellia sp. 75C3]|nr:hypothetical protein CXF85_17910 [Colwellia sp. 75C3]
MEINRLNEITDDYSFDAESAGGTVVFSLLAEGKAESKRMNDQLIKMNNQFVNKETSSTRIKGTIKAIKVSTARKLRLAIS